MDVKDLNKTQLIMLALLLSFVTSIATGIVTVTLMQQAPKSFTEPVNHVVQQTVDKIEQVEGKTVTQTVVIKEEDLVVDAIAKNQSAIFSVSKVMIDDTGNPVEMSIGRGIAVSTDGIVAVDGADAVDNGIYYVKNDSGKFKASFVSADKSGFSFLKIGDPVNGTDKLIFTVPTFGDLTTMKAGQEIIVLGANISSFIFDGDKDLKISATKANIGSPVLDLDGDVLGITLSNDASFVLIKNITDALAALSTPLSKTDTTTINVPITPFPTATP